MKSRKSMKPAEIHAIMNALFTEENGGNVSSCIEDVFVRFCERISNGETTIEVDASCCKTHFKMSNILHVKISSINSASVIDIIDSHLSDLNLKCLCLKKCSKVCIKNAGFLTVVFENTVPIKLERKLSYHEHTLRYMCHLEEGNGIYKSSFAINSGVFGNYGFGSVEPMSADMVNCKLICFSIERENDELHFEKLCYGLKTLKYMSNTRWNLLTLIRFQ